MGLIPFLSPISIVYQKMTTAARPTWEPARGGGMRGETDLGKLSKQVCTRDLPSQTTLKYRLDGQGTEDEYGTAREFKKDLEVRERKAREERNKDKAFRGSSSASQITQSAITSGQSRSGRRHIDADDPVDDSEDDSSDEEDETADLLAELNKIKAEREEEKRIEEEERIRTDNILKGNPLLQNEAQKSK